MIDTLIKIMPLLIASTMSPGILALSIVLLSKEKFGKSQTLALLVGSILTSIIIITIGLILGQKIQDPLGKSIIDNIFEILFAIIFLYFGLKNLLYKENNKTQKITQNETKKLFLWFGIGFAVSITNFDAVIFDITAAKEIGQALISNFQKIILLIIEAFFFNLPIIFPFLLYIIMPKTAQKILNPLNIFLNKYGRLIVGTIFIGFAIYLFYKGLINI